MEYFLAVSRERSFTKAAESLYMSQPAITNAINTLEGELGIKLFIRTKRLVTLTGEGQIFYNYVSSLMKDVNHTLYRMNELRESSLRLIKVAVNSLIATTMFLPMLGEYQESYPNSQVIFTTSSNERIRHMMETKGYHIGIILGNSDPHPNAKMLTEGKMTCFRTAQPEGALTTIVSDGNDEPGKQLSSYLHRNGITSANLTRGYDIVSYMLEHSNRDVFLPSFFRCPEHRVNCPLDENIDASAYLVTQANLPKLHQQFIELLERGVKIYG